MKIFFKTSGPVLLFVLVIFLGFSFWLVPSLSAALTQWDDDSERSGATILAMALSDDMKAGRIADASATLSRVWANRPDWALVEVYDEGGTRLYPATAAPPPEGLQKVSVRITRTKERLGRLVVYFDGSLRARTVHHVVHDFELAVLTIGSGLLGLTLVLHWIYVTRPIRQLRKKFTYGRQPDPDALPAVFAKDEIGDLSRSFEQFRRALASRERALTDARRMAEEELQTNIALRVRAEAANQSKSDFISMVSHELRTPMNAIVGMTSVVTNGPLDDGLRLKMKTIEESSEHLLALINQILDFGSVESGKELLEPVAFDPRDLVSACIRIVESLPAAGKLRIESLVSEAVPRLLRGDARRIKQVLLNLMGNAVKFTDLGSVLLAVDVVPEAAGSVRLCLAVRDSGQGIAASMQHKIFEPFVKLSGFSEGTGLGLSICLRYAQLMGGELTMESKEGVGSTFRFCVPLETVDLPPSEPVQPAVTAGALALIEPEAPLQVLVAEDTPTSALVMRLLLEGMGHTVRVVENGLEALQALEQGAFDLVLLDIQMPVMGGLEAARAIRCRQGAGSLLPIIGCSALASDVDRQNAIDCGMTDYLVKPVHRKDFQLLMDRIGLHGSRAPEKALKL